MAAILPESTVAQPPECPADIEDIADASSELSDTEDKEEATAEQGSKPKRTIRMLTEGTGFLLQSLLRDQQKPPPIVNDVQTREIETNVAEKRKKREKKAVNLGVKLPSKSVDCRFSDAKLLQTVVGAYEKVDGFANNFLKGCQWSPDGRWLLTNSEDRCIRVLRMNDVVVDRFTTEAGPSHSQPTDGCDMLSLSSTRQHGDTIYDYCWYPLLRNCTDDSATSGDGQAVFATTSRDHPVHMWAVKKSAIERVASYRPINHLDELTSAHSLCFSLDGARLYTGFNKTIRVFDVNRPGRNHLTIATQVKVMGRVLYAENGIVSCFAMNPSIAGAYVAASYGRSIGLFSDQTKSLETLFKAHTSGITSVAFSSDGTKLFSAARKDRNLICWDIRNPGKMLFTVQRRHSTNQRLYFALDSCDRHLVSGDADGWVNVWNLDAINDDVDLDCVPPTVRFLAHSSIVNGISLNPQSPLLATASGERRFPLRMLESDDSEEELPSNCSEQQSVKLCDNSVKLWWLGEDSPSFDGDPSMNTAS